MLIKFRAYPRGFTRETSIVAAESDASRKSETSEERPATSPAERALAEAAVRRATQKQFDRPREIDGRQGPEPTRYGDWEVRGLASDF
jgi:hypothetical protein